MKYKRLQYILFAIVVVIILAYIGMMKIDHSKPISQQNLRELAILKKLAENRQYYRDSLQAYLDSVMLDLHKNTQYSKTYRYNLNRQLLAKSQMYSFDNANHFSERMISIADNIGEPNRMAEARILSTFYLSQACLFVESNDIFRSIDIESPIYNDTTRTEYYLYAGISYQRMAVYVNDSVNRAKYNALGNEMFEKCVALHPEEGVKALAQGRILEREGKMHEALPLYEKAVASIPEEKITLRSLALSSLAKAYKMEDRNEGGLTYYIKATQLNIINAMNSSIAVFDLAEHLYYNYNNEREATRYMQVAIENGEYFGMRSSINHIDRIVPELARSESAKEIRISVATILLFVLILTFLGRILVTHIQSSKRIIEYEEETKTQKEEKENLDAANEQLNTTNQQLKEQNKVKDIYIGRLLEQNSELSATFTEFAIKAEQKCKKQQYDQVLQLIKNINSNFNRKEQYAWLDELILSLFPDFVEEFNSLVVPEARSTGDSKQLTPAMRIFALIRLGIKDNHQIARILNYSYNTILNYRVRTRGLALNPTTFEAAIV